MSKDAWLGWYKDRKVEPAVVDFARLLKNARATKVLDFGCGTGRNTIYLSRLGFGVYGFDWSKAAIKMVKEELSRQGLDAHLRVWDMNKIPLPYGDSFFDGVLVMRVLHHTYLTKIKRIASEIRRVTKSGGYLYIEVPTYEKAMRLKREGLKSEEPEPGTFVPTSGDEAGIPHHHFRKTELTALFSGFSPKTVVERQEQYCMTASRN